MNLEEALGQFDRTQANLERLESVWERMQELIPEGVSFPGTTPEELLYDELAGGFAELVAGLPAIESVRLEVTPLSLSEIAHRRFDANEADVPEMWIELSEEINEPANAIADYRYRLGKARRQLVRRRVIELVAAVDGALADLGPRYQSDGRSVADDADWKTLGASVREIERLLAQDLGRKGRWGDLARHLRFAQGGDLHDIIEHDWPSVRADIETALYSETEPLPVEAEDLGALAAAKPEGAVTTALNWEALDDDDFERLVFNLLTTASDYENPQWLMKTRAPDRGRDLSVDRVLSDSLSGVTRKRVIVQCRHWRQRSMNADDCIAAAGHVSLWEPPPVDVLIVATSGRFTENGVQWIEKHNNDGTRPAIDMWPESHLEMLLARRPALVTELGLRSP